MEALVLLLLERRVAGVAGHRRHLGRAWLLLGSGFGSAPAGGGGAVAFGAVAGGAEAVSRGGEVEGVMAAAAGGEEAK